MPDPAPYAQSGNKLSRYVGLTSFFTPIRVSYRDIKAFMNIGSAATIITAGDEAPAPAPPASKTKPKVTGPQQLQPVKPQDDAVDTSTRFNLDGHGFEVLIVDDARGFDINLIK